MKAETKDCFMSLQSKGLWNMSLSNQQHVHMLQAAGKDKCKLENVEHES